ncbi:MAG: helix-turn-helix domain-containing protein [Proteobacteria bacterium]|nr:helix-turn-helix domain-containing protein [Pseudomonadota bacterium]
METTRHPKKASHQDWHPADVVAALHKRGLTLRKLAERYNISPPAVIKALRERNLPSERRIAEAIGIPASDIWPSRYNPDGSRTDLRKLTRPARAVNGNVRVAT